MNERAKNRVDDYAEHYDPDGVPSQMWRLG
jgi:hypothetical protein